MTAEKLNKRLISPWSEFLTELDGILTEPLEFHCIGGFMLVHFYGLPGTTGDIDYFTAVPANLNLVRPAAARFRCSVLRPGEVVRKLPGKLK
jgi:hypothetical protein